MTNWLERDQNKWSVVQEGTRSSHQSAGTFSHKVHHFDISQKVKYLSHAYSARQYDTIELSAENGRNRESRTNADFKENLGVYTRAGDHDYSQIFTRES